MLCHACSPVKNIKLTKLVMKVLLIRKCCPTQPVAYSAITSLHEVIAIRPLGGYSGHATDSAYIVARTSRINSKTGNEKGFILVVLAGEL